MLYFPLYLDGDTPAPFLGHRRVSCDIFFCRTLTALGQRQNFKKKELHFVFFLFEFLEMNAILCTIIAYVLHFVLTCNGTCTVL